MEDIENAEQTEMKEVVDPTKRDIAETKSFRVTLDGVLQHLKDSPRKSRERSLAVTKLQECIMWLGMDLKDLGSSNPYPNSYKPENATVDPTADGLRM